MVTNNTSDRYTASVCQLDGSLNLAGQRLLGSFVRIDPAQALQLTAVQTLAIKMESMRISKLSIHFFLLEETRGQASMI